MDIGSGITYGSMVLGTAAVVIKWISASSKQDNQNGNGNVIGRGVCPAHQDLVAGLTAFRKEVGDQFSNLTSEIMELCKEIKRG